MFDLFEKARDFGTTIITGAKNNPKAAASATGSALVLGVSCVVNRKNTKEYEKFKQNKLNKNLSTNDSLDIDDTKADVNNDED